MVRELSMRVRALLLTVIVFLWGSMACGDGQRASPGREKFFCIPQKNSAFPSLRPPSTLKMGPPPRASLSGQVHVVIFSVNLGFLFRVNNRFLSTMEAETCAPVQYVKEIDQDGLFKEKKNYLETLTFDPQNQKVVIERKGTKEKREVILPPETFDPLSMFARCYLKEDLQSHQEIRMNIYDGLRLRQMVFQPKEERVTSKILGEVEAVRLEAITSFASFEDREGIIRIWYAKDGKKTPLLMELDLPVGKVRFELDEIREG